MWWVQRAIWGSQWPTCRTQCLSHSSMPPSLPPGFSVQRWRCFEVTQKDKEALSSLFPCHEAAPSANAAQPWRPQRKAHAQRKLPAPTPAATKLTPPQQHPPVAAVPPGRGRTPCPRSISRPAGQPCGRSVFDSSSALGTSLHWFPPLVTYWSPLCS